MDLNSLVLLRRHQSLRYRKKYTNERIFGLSNTKTIIGLFVNNFGYWDVAQNRHPNIESQRFELQEEEDDDCGFHETDSLISERS